MSDRRKSHDHPSPVWKLEDAKARFSEVVRRARDGAPQCVTVRGEEAVVIVDAGEWKRLTGSPKRKPLTEFLRETGLGELPIDRPLDRGRDIDL